MRSQEHFKEGQQGETHREVLPASPGPSALCLSGGGIRSAIFGLGVLQALARFGWLHQFDYLSTVSGGGYIGSWLTAWIHREIAIAGSHLGAVHKVEQAIAASTLRGINNPEPEPLRRLRQYCSYLAPRSGLSADLLAVISLYLRNLALNLMVLIPLFACVILLAVALFVALPSLFVSNIRGIHTSLPCLAFLLGLAALAALIVIAYTTSDLPKARLHQTQYSHFFRYWTLPTVIGVYALSQFLSAQTLGTIPVVLSNPWLIGGAAGLHIFGVILGTVIRPFRALALDPQLALTLRQRIRDSFQDLGWTNLLSASASGVIAGVAAVAACGVAHVVATIPAVLECGFAFQRFTLECLLPPLLLMAFQLGTTVYIAMLADAADEGAREWWGRAGGTVLVLISVWVTAGVLFIGLPILIDAHSHPVLTSVTGTLGSLLGILTAALGYSGKTGAPDPASSRTRSIPAALISRFMFFGALCFVAVLAIASSWTLLHLMPLLIQLLERPDTLGPLAHLWRWIEPISSGFVLPTSVESRTPFVLVEVETHAGYYLAALIIGIVVTYKISAKIQRNRYSLTALYGNRIVRAFPGSSLPQGQRAPHAFTQFDPADDLALAEIDAGPPLKHVINAALSPTGILEPGGDRHVGASRRSA